MLDILLCMPLVYGTSVNHNFLFAITGVYWNVTTPYVSVFRLSSSVFINNKMCHYSWPVTCDCVAEEVITLFIVSCQKGQRTGLSFHFVFFHKHLRHPAWTHFPKTMLIRQFHEEVTMKFVENAGKVTKWWIICSLESSLPLHTPNLL
jgi:hypothetical protein